MPARVERSADAKVSNVCKSNILGSSPSEKILVIFPGALGDLICLFPTLRALARRHCGASLELMANDDLIRLAVGRMGVDRGHSIHDQAVAQLFKQQIDAVEERMKSAFGGFTRIYSFFGAKDPDFRRNLKRVCPDTLCLPFAPEGSGHMARSYLA